MKISPYLRNTEGGGLVFFCPGCKERHHIQVGEGPGPRWGYNGNPDRPTFTPSILVTWNEPANLKNPGALNRDLETARQRREAGETNVKVPSVGKVCHSFVTDGRIQFLADCTHELAGQTVDMVPLPGDAA